MKHGRCGETRTGPEIRHGALWPRKIAEANNHTDRSLVDQMPACIRVGYDGAEKCTVVTRVTR